MSADGILDDTAQIAAKSAFFRRVVEVAQGLGEVYHHELANVFGVGLLKPPRPAVSQEQLAVFRFKLAPCGLIRPVANAGEKRRLGQIMVHNGAICENDLTLLNRSRPRVRITIDEGEPAEEHKNPLFIA